MAWPLKKIWSEVVDLKTDPTVLADLLRVQVGRLLSTYRRQCYCAMWLNFVRRFIIYLSGTPQASSDNAVLLRRVVRTAQHKLSGVTRDFVTRRDQPQCGFSEVFPSRPLNLHLLVPTYFPRSEFQKSHRQMAGKAARKCASPCAPCPRLS